MNMIPSFVFRRRAMAAIRPAMSVLVVVALLVALPGLINTTVTLITKADPNIYLAGPMQDMADFADQVRETGSINLLQQVKLAALMEKYTTACETFLKEKGVIFFSLAALEILLTPVMTMALYSALLDAHRKQPLTVGSALARLRYAFKTLLLFLWTSLRLIAWMLPGLALELASILLPAPMTTPLMVIGLVLALVLGVRAALHYVLAPVVLADQPSRGINECIRISWTAMRTRKMEYFMLRLSFAGWTLLCYLLTSLLLGLLGNVLGMTLSMMAELLLNIYVSAAVVAFYDAYVVRGDKPEDLRAEFEGAQHSDGGANDDLN